MEDLLNAKKYQSDHIIPRAYIERLPGLSWSITNWMAYFYDLDTQVLIPRRMNASKNDKGPLKYCPPFGLITGGSDLINHYKKASLAKKIVVENYCFTWEHIAKKWDIYKYLDKSTTNIITQILKEAKVAGRSPKPINPHY